MSESQRIVVLLSTDLMFGSTVSGFASAAGVGFQNPSSGDGIAARGEQASAHLLLIDLETPGLDISALADAKAANWAQHECYGEGGARLTATDETFRVNYADI